MIEPNARQCFRIVQLYGPDKARESTLVSEHPSAADAFATIDHLAAEMVRTCTPSTMIAAIELIVIDEDDRIVQRPGAH
jgi:hypothetical protein